MLLAQVGGSDVVHVVKLHVLAAHRPDERIIRGADTAVDAPGGADDSVLVVHHDVAGLRGLAAHVEHHLPLGQFKVGVDLHPALMRVAGHGVPVGAGLQFLAETRKTHGIIISVSVVRVSPDLSTAKAYLSIFPPEKSAEMIENINANTKTIRYELSQRVRYQLRKTPELSFFLDDSLDYIENIDSLLKK